MIIETIMEYISLIRVDESEQQLKERVQLINEFKSDFTNVFQSLVENLHEKRFSKPPEIQIEIRKIYSFYTNVFNRTVHSFENLLLNVDWSKDGIVSFNTKAAVELLKEDCNKFNHLDILKYIKKRALEKGGNTLWIKIVAELRGYILLTQTKDVIDYFYDDLVKYFRGKSLSSPLLQLFIDLNMSNKKIYAEFIENKKIYIPMIKNSFETKDGEYYEFLIRLVEFLKDDFIKLVPSKIDSHILDQKGNSVQNSDFWTIDFDVLVRNLNLKSGGVSNTVSYNLFLSSFVKCLKNVGWEIYLIQPLEGRKKDSKACIVIKEQSVDGITTKDIQDYFDYVVNNVMNKKFLNFTISDFVKNDIYNGGYKCEEMEKVFVITYQSFLMEKSLDSLAMSNAKSLLKKQ